ncbi:MAG: dTMP kinase [Acidobacteria bacterium 13_1_40CM_2_68_5]|nr:MAG: dTMP kinase [Acidobacteria bacterium 13_1_40CM_2_68_5]
MIPGKEGAKFYGHGLPYAGVRDLKGTLITLEGTDGVGRTTQVALLKEWLEVQGYGVIETGWTRSELMSETIGAAKAGHNLNQLTFSLLYATDFADRLEKIILPALRSGFVVLADRYVFTAFARSVVRGADPVWIRSVFGFALVPDLTLYLKTDADTLVRRVLGSRGIDYWESGMDMHLGTDLFESFRKYQWRLIRQYNRMAREFGFVTVDATLGVDEIQARIRRRVQALLDDRRMQVLSTSLDTIRPLLFEAEEDEAAAPVSGPRSVDEAPARPP